ncbi:MAG: Ig-like domain-containing protein, partial [Treponema sp.]|nr:Ig-like domain-containing protein [Treponema sp.]
MNLKKCFYSVISKSILLFSLISILIFSSCEVGLGESVDTENPSVEITYPPNGSVIRGSFTFAGVCADDKGVSKVLVTVRKNDDASFVKEYEAKILDGGKWTCILNEVQDDKSPTALQEKVFPFADGKYEIKAVAIDSSNRQSDGISRTYEIDNTPPVFIISSPVVTDTENATEYGSIFKISGKIADDHAPLSSMKVSVFDQDGSKIDGNESWTFSKVDISGGTTVNAARYFTKENLSPEEEILYKNYINIYGENTEGDKVFTCTIEIEDSAKEWNEPNFDSKKEVVNTTEGNKTTKLYLNDSIYSLLMGADSEYQLEAGGIKDILNGTTKNDTVLSILNEKIIDTKETKLAFSLNKKANPIYSINGYDVKKLNFASNSGSKNQTVTFQVQAGLNGTSVSPETFKLYLFGPFEKDSLTQDEIQKIYDNPEASSKTYSEKCSVIFDGTSYSKGSVATFTQAVSLPEAISSGQVYIFAASGKDLDNLDLQTSNDTVYGFQGISAGTPPKVYISEPASDGLVIKENSSLVIKGIAESAESKIASVKYEIAVYDTLKSDENGKFIKVGEISGNAVSDSGFGLPVVSYSCSVKDGTVKLENGYTSVNPGDGKIFSYEIKVTVQDDSNTESFIERNIYLDNAKPVPVITNVDPVAEKKLDANGNVSEKKINGTVTVSGKVSEKNLKSLVLTVKDKDGKTETYTYSEASFEEPIDTTLLSDGNITISLEAIDEAGNPSVIEENYTVDQSTDKPVIKFSNGKDSTVIKDFDKVNKTQNTFGVETNNKAVFNFTDDDGLEKVTITLLDKDGKTVDASVVQIQENQKEPINPVVYTFDGSTTALVNYILPKKEGMYILEVEAVDVEYNNVSDREDADKVKTYRTSKTKNYIAVSDSNFNIKFNSANIINDECSTQKVETTIKGIVTVSAEEKIKSIERYEITQDKNGEWVKGSLVSSYKNDATPEKNTIKITKDANSSYVQWKEIVPVDKMQEGVKNFRYIATDTTDVSVSIDLKWNVDDTLPELHKNAYTESNADKWLNSTSQTLIYIVRDKESNGYASGIDSVKYSFKNGEKPTEGYFARGASCDENGNEKADTKDWILYKTTFDLPEGDSTLVTVTAFDKVGNKKEDTPVFKIDTDIPTVTSSIPKGQCLQDTEISVTFDCKDATSGIQTVELATNSNMQGAVPLTGNKIVSPYDYSLSGLKDGTYSIYVRATDNAGNKSEAVLAGEVIVDTIAPKVEIKTPVSGATVNKTISFTGTVTDNNLSKSAEPVLQYKNGDVWTPLNYASTSLTNQEWTITGVDTTALNKDITPKDFEFRVVFTDKAGNSNDSDSGITLKVDQNADRPVIKFTNINLDGSSKVSSKEILGVISD